MLVLMYGSETVIWKEKKGSKLELYRWTTSEFARCYEDG